MYFSIGFSAARHLMNTYLAGMYLKMMFAYVEAVEDVDRARVDLIGSTNLMEVLSLN